MSPRHGNISVPTLEIKLASPLGKKFQKVMSFLEDSSIHVINLLLLCQPAVISSYKTAPTLEIKSHTHYTGKKYPVKKVDNVQFCGTSHFPVNVPSSAGTFNSFLQINESTIPLFARSFQQ